MALRRNAWWADTPIPGNVSIAARNDRSILPVRS